MLTTWAGHSVWGIRKSRFMFTGRVPMLDEKKYTKSFEPNLCHEEV